MDDPGGIVAALESIAMMPYGKSGGRNAGHVFSRLAVMLLLQPYASCFRLTSAATPHFWHAYSLFPSCYQSSKVAMSSL